jgi:hypothetical protein
VVHQGVSAAFLEEKEKHRRLPTAQSVDPPNERAVGTAHLIALDASDQGAVCATDIPTITSSDQAAICIPDVAAVEPKIKTARTGSNIVPVKLKKEISVRTSNLAARDPPD